MPPVSTCKANIKQLNDKYDTLHYCDYNSECLLKHYELLHNDLNIWSLYFCRLDQYKNAFKATLQIHNIILHCRNKAYNSLNM